MCVNEAGSIRLMEEKDVEQVEELEKQCFSVPWSENILKDGLTGRFDTYLVWEKEFLQMRERSSVLRSFLPGAVME